MNDKARARLRRKELEREMGMAIAQVYLSRIFQINQGLKRLLNDVDRQRWLDKAMPLRKPTKK